MMKTIIDINITSAYEIKIHCNKIGPLTPHIIIPPNYEKIAEIYVKNIETYLNNIKGSEELTKI